MQSPARAPQRVQVHIAEWKIEEQAASVQLRVGCVKNGTRWASALPLKLDMTPGERGGGYLQPQSA